MRKLVLTLLLSSVPAWATDSYTPNLGLRLPETGVEDTSLDWNDKFNQNWNIIDSSVTSITGASNAILNGTNTWTGSNTHVASTTFNTTVQLGSAAIFSTTAVCPKPDVGYEISAASVTVLTSTGGIVGSPSGTGTGTLLASGSDCGAFNSSRAFSFTLAAGTYTANVMLTGRSAAGVNPQVVSSTQTATFYVGSNLSSTTVNTLQTSTEPLRVYAIAVSSSGGTFTVSFTAQTYGPVGALRSAALDADYATVHGSVEVEGNSYVSGDETVTGDISAANATIGGDIAVGSTATVAAICFSGDSSCQTSASSGGMALLSATQTWTGGNTFQSSTTFTAPVLIGTTTATRPLHVVARGNNGLSGFAAFEALDGAYASATASLSLAVLTGTGVPTITFATTPAGSFTPAKIEYYGGKNAIGITVSTDAATNWDRVLVSALTGNVGIGTAAPAALLDIEGTDSGTLPMVLVSSGVWLTTGTLRIGSGATSSSMTASGFRGIGTNLTALTPANLSAGSLPSNVIASSLAVGSLVPGIAQVGLYPNIQVASVAVNTIYPAAAHRVNFNGTLRSTYTETADSPSGGRSLFTATVPVNTSWKFYFNVESDSSTTNGTNFIARMPTDISTATLTCKGNGTASNNIKTKATTTAAIWTEATGNFCLSATAFADDNVCAIDCVVDVTFGPSGAYIDLAAKVQSGGRVKFKASSGGWGEQYGYAGAAP